MGMHLPMLDGHERPTGVPSGRSIAITSARKDALDAVRADELDLYVAATCMSNPHFDSNMLQRSEVMLRQHLLRNGYLTLDTALNDRAPPTGLP